MSDTKIDWENEVFEGMMKLDGGYDSAVIGIASRCSSPDVIAYSSEKIVEILAQEMSNEDAVEFFIFNILGSWMGETTPYFVSDIPEDYYE